jgi:uncharacterized glyoxalase superfamily protein PhnB
MKQAREWYERVLDFKTTFLNSEPVEDPDGNYAILQRDSAVLHLILDELNDPSADRAHPWTRAGTGYLFLIVRGVDAVLERAQAQGAAVRRGIEKESWGARAFQLTDPSGNLILVANET